MTTTTAPRRGLMLILSSPSGAGKTTLSRLLLERDANFRMSVSTTTRPPRPGEVQGKDYFFVDDATFAKLVEDGELLEHAEVFGHRYGTRAAPVQSYLEQGHDVLFDIDWQGAQQIAQRAPEDLVRIFILPPSAAALEARLKTRAQDPPEVVARRMAGAAEEINHWAEYDYVLINDVLDVCLAQIETIIAAERLRRHRQIHLPEFVKSLKDGL